MHRGLMISATKIYDYCTTTTTTTTITTTISCITQYQVLIITGFSTYLGFFDIFHILPGRDMYKFVSCIWPFGKLLGHGP